MVAERPIICRPPPEILWKLLQTAANITISYYFSVSRTLGLLLISSDYLWLSMVISKYLEYNTCYQIYQHLPTLHDTKSGGAAPCDVGAWAQAPCFNASCASAVSSYIAVLNLLVHNITSCQTGQIQCLWGRCAWHGTQSRLDQNQL